jgi:hypothetical protein
MGLQWWWRSWVAATCPAAAACASLCELLVEAGELSCVRHMAPGLS